MPSDFARSRATSAFTQVSTLRDSHSSLNSCSHAHSRRTAVSAFQNHPHEYQRRLRSNACCSVHAASYSTSHGRTAASILKCQNQGVCREARGRELLLPLGRAGLRRRAVRPEDFADFEVRRCQNSLQVSLDHGHNRQCWHGTGSSLVCLMPTCWIAFVRALWRPCQNDALENDLLEARLRSS